MPEVQTLHYAGAAHAIVLHDAGAVATHIRRVLALWPERAPDPEAPPITVARMADGAFSVASPFLDEPIEGLTAVAAACGAIVDTAQSYLSLRPDHLCLHSTTFEIGGRLVVLTGHAHAGKSTLAARLAAENADIAVYCDDMLPLRAPDDVGLALGIPPRPRLPLPPGAGPTLLGHLSRHAAAQDGKYCYLDTKNLAPHGRAAPIGAVLLLDRRRDGPAGFLPAGPGEALRHLLQRNMVRNEAPRALTERLHALLRTVPCARLHYARLDDAAALLMKTFGAWPLPGDAFAPAGPGPGAPLEENPSRPAARRLDPPDPARPYRRDPGVSARRVGEELFLFDAQDRSVLNLNPLAAGIWALLADPVSLGDAVDALAVAFPDIARDTIAADTGALFADFLRHELIVPA